MKGGLFVAFGSSALVLAQFNSGVHAARKRVVAGEPVERGKTDGAEINLEE